MSTLLTPAGGFDRRAIMREAHKLFRQMRRLGADDWPFARCLRYAWAKARGQRANREARGPSAIYPQGIRSPKRAIYLAKFPWP